MLSLCTRWTECVKEERRGGSVISFLNKSWNTLNSQWLYNLCKQFVMHSWKINPSSKCCMAARQTVSWSHHFQDFDDEPDLVQMFWRNQDPGGFGVWSRRRGVNYICCHDGAERTNIQKSLDSKRNQVPENRSVPRFWHQVTPRIVIPDQNQDPGACTHSGYTYCTI